MKKIYKDQPYSVYELCKDTKISVGMIYEYIAGNKKWENMSIRIFKKIADYSGLSMDQLYKEIKGGANENI